MKLYKLNMQPNFRFQVFSNVKFDTERYTADEVK